MRCLLTKLQLGVELGAYFAHFFTSFSRREAENVWPNEGQGTKSSNLIETNSIDMPFMQVGMAAWDSSRTPIKGSWVRSSVMTACEKPSGGASGPL